MRVSSPIGSSGGREVAARGKGVVRDEAVRMAAIDTVAQSVARAGFVLLGRCDAVIAGPKDNREAFLHARRA